MKIKSKILLSIITLAAFSLLSSAKDGDVICEGFLDLSKWDINKNLANVSADGKTLHIDCSEKGGTDFNHVAITKRGMFKPDTFYTIKFDCNVPENNADKYLHTFVRNAKNHDPKTDLGSLNSNYTYGHSATKKLVFKTPNDAADFSYFITTHDKTKLVYSNFSITEGNGEGLISIAANPKKYVVDVAKLPTGAKEFTVDLPNNKSGKIVYAKDFGVTEGCENPIEKINAAILHCREIGAAKVVVEKGVYRTGEQQSITLEDMKDFEFEASGATFIFSKRKGNVNFRIINCARTLVNNLNFDWDWENNPLASVVEAVSVKNDTPDGYVDYKFVEYDKFPRRDLRVSNLSSYDPATKSVGVEGGFDTSYEFFDGKNKPKTEWISDNVLRVFSDSEKIRRIAQGMLFRMQHYYYDMGGFVMYGNQHLTLRNINVWSCAGHAFVVDGPQKYWHFDNVNIVRPPNSQRRAITCSADHLHIARSCGFFKMENCEFSLGADDCINMHDCSNFSRRHSDHVVRTQNAGGFPAGTKVEFRQGDYSPANFIGTVKGTKEIDPHKRIYEIEFEEVLPQQLFDGFVMFNTAYDTRNIIVRNCFFHDNRARGILILARDVTIENCRFRHNEMGAIKIETGYTFNVWSEGYGVDNVVIRNNAFHTSNPLDVKNAGRARDIVMSVYMKTDPSPEQTMYPILNNILLDGNTMNDTFGLITFIASTGNVTIMNNTFINNTPRKNPLEYRGDFFVTHSTNTHIVNNTWLKSPYVETPSVIYEKESVKGLVVQGNKIIDKLEF